MNFIVRFVTPIWFGEIASFLLGAVYIALVLFVPFGIVGTWQVKALGRKRGFQRLRKLIGLEKSDEGAT